MVLTRLLFRAPREVDLLLSGKHMPLATLLYTTFTRWLLKTLGVCSDLEVHSCPAPTRLTSVCAVATASLSRA